jgi:hypothetical protein
MPASPHSGAQHDRDNGCLRLNPGILSVALLLAAFWMLVVLVILQD